MSTKLDAKSLRRAFSSYMTGVTVITARATNGQLVGFTANSFTSVSLNPALLLVCPGKHLNSFDVFSQCEYFTVSVLAENQEDVSNCFASSGNDKFSTCSWQKNEHNLPLIDGASATFSCRVYERHPAGDHILLIGEVLGFSHTETPGLGYCCDGYFSLNKEQQADSSGKEPTKKVAGMLIEHNSKLLVHQDGTGWYLPTVEQPLGTGARSTLKEYALSQGLSVTLGPVYSIYDDTLTQRRFTYFRAVSKDVKNAETDHFIAINEINPALFPDQAQATILARFLSEHKNNQFGLYVGDIESGEVFAQVQ